jgi:O-antigen ligase
LGTAAFFLALRDLRYLVRAMVGLVICLGLIVVWGSYWLPETFEQRVLSPMRSGSVEQAGSFEERLVLMAEALEMVDQTMVVGIGVDQYRVKSQFGVPVHNTYLLLWTEGGLPALIGWISLLMIALFGAPFIGRHHRLEAATAFAIAVIFVAIGFTTGHVYARYLVIPLCLAMALVMAAAAEPRPRRAPRYPPPRMTAASPPREAASEAAPTVPTGRPGPPGARW